MPKLNNQATELQKKKTLTRSILKYNQTLYSLKTTEICESTGCVGTMWYHYTENPDKIRLYDLWKLADVIHLTPEQGASIVLGREVTKGDLLKEMGMR